VSELLQEESDNALKLFSGLLLWQSRGLGSLYWMASCRESFRV